MEATDEATQSSRPSLAEELSGYKHTVTLHMADRDGDRYYVECPECHSMRDIRAKRIMACGSCFTHFNLYFEDGHRRIDLTTQDPWISGGDEIKVLWTKGKREGTPYILYGRNNHKNRLDKLRETYPDMYIETIERDLHGGMDAHGHERYTTYDVKPRESAETIKALEALQTLNANLTRSLVMMDRYMRYVKGGGKQEFEEWSKDKG